MPRRSPAASRRRVPAWLLGAALALGPLAACGPAGPAQPSPEPICTLPDPPRALSRGSLRLPADPAVLLLGDSYTEGYGAQPETKGWAYLVGGPLGWRVSVNGVGGTGFVNPGPNAEGTYLQRLPALRGQTFDLVVIQGGSNDRDTSYPALTDAVARTVGAVRTEFPGTAVVLLGPASPYGKSDGVRLVAQCTLAVYAGQQSLPFVDPIAEDWFVDGDGDRYANPENGHPNAAGYRRYAARFEADVRVLTAAG